MTFDPKEARALVERLTLARAEKAEAERDTAWNDAIEAAARIADTEARAALKYEEEAVCESYCNDIALSIRTLKKGDTP